MGLQFRQAIGADAESIATLHVRSWRETYGGILPPATLASLSVDDRKSMWERVLESSGTQATVLVAEDENRLVGFAACSQQRDERLLGMGFTGEIGAIYVDLTAQRRGIGSSLMKRMASHLQAQGHEGASLWVLRDNGPARAFYERLGGEIVGEKESVEAATILIEIGYGWRNLGALLA